MDTKRILKDARLLGSTSEKELRLLEPAFVAALRTWQRQGKPDRQRAPGARQKGLLLTVREKLLFILV